MNTRTRQVSRALRAIQLAPDTRALKRECQLGNPYVLAYLERRGLIYDPAMGAIRQKGVTA
jgi:hypothetical protein